MREESDALKAIHTGAGENPAEAIEGYRKYIEAHPNSHLAYSYLGGTLQKAKDWDGSLAAYREAERIAGEEKVVGSTARLQIGKVLQDKGDIEATIAQYRKIIEAVSPENGVSVSSAYFYLGNALNEQANEVKHVPPGSRQPSGTAPKSSRVKRKRC
jgi:tetratricopeptide (TPR) repeat protein